VGAVQRLATVVIIGLVGLSMVLILYIADESNRQDAETEEQDEVAIERGTADYLQYCLVCHGPAGEGREEGTGRPGAPLGGSMTSTNQEGINNEGTPVPGGFAARTTLINDTIHRGRPQLGMPTWGAAYGGELTDDQINNLTYMIQHVDWNLVYNQAIEVSGGYPTVPPQATSAPAGGTPAEGGEGAQPITVDLVDTAFNPNKITVKANTPTKITLTNKGAIEHTFTVADLGIDERLAPVETKEITINAAAGTYEFVCSVPGHAQAGMVGTLTIE
jgi:uncharacterized cupredoxin-like copper-binding protein/mono/diheme cytochrome c family protein